VSVAGNASILTGHDGVLSDSIGVMEWWSHGVMA
jgi:hypothetical protein